MKVTSQHLDAVQKLRQQAKIQFDSDEKAVTAAIEKLRTSKETLRSITGSFDSLTAVFLDGGSEDSGIDDTRMSQMHPLVLSAIGYVKQEPVPEKISEAKE